MAKKDIIVALENPKRQFHSSKGELNKVFWKLIIHYNIGLKSLYEGIMQYVSDPRNCEQTTARRTETRNNLISTIMRDNLTWRYFIRALKAIQITRIEFNIRAYRGKSKVVADIYHEINLHTVIDTDEDVSDEQSDDSTGSV